MLFQFYFRTGESGYRNYSVGSYKYFLDFFPDIFSKKKFLLTGIYILVARYTIYSIPKSQ